MSVVSSKSLDFSLDLIPGHVDLSLNLLELSLLVFTHRNFEVVALNCFMVLVHFSHGGCKFSFPFVPFLSFHNDAMQLTQL